MTTNYLSNILSMQSDKLSDAEIIKNPNNHISLKKTIAKVIKSKNKKFIKKIFYVESISKLKIIQHHRFTLFRYVDIEGFYQDLQSYDNTCNFFNSSNAHIYKTICHNQTGELTFYLQLATSSGIKDFQFLIDHFDKLNNPIYQQLADVLLAYQQQCHDQAAHLRVLKDKIKCRILDVDSVNVAVKQFEKYAQSVIANSFKDTDFYLYQIFTVNPEEEDLNLDSFTISNQLLRLIGYDGKQKMDEIMSLVNLSEMFGLFRLQIVVNQLQLLTGNQSSFVMDHEFVTIDEIKIQVALEFKLIKWPNRPIWMESHDVFALTVQAHVSDNQINAMQKIREDRLTKHERSIVQRFEQQIRSEMFIEKFYPKIWKFHRK